MKLGQLSNLVLVFYLFLFLQQTQSSVKQKACKIMKKYDHYHYSLQLEANCKKYNSDK